METRSQALPPSPQFGVLLFDDPTLASRSRDGWASVAGEPATRHQGVPDLDSDIIWITNAEFAAAREHGLGNIHNVRGSTFLSSSIKAISDDLRRSSFEVNMDVATRTIGSIIDRTCRTSHQMYRVPDLFSGYTLAQGIQRAVFPEGDLPPADLAYALKSAYQKSSMCDNGRAWMENPHYFKVRLGRIEHATDVLSGAVPDGPVEYISGSKLRITDAEFYADKPVLAKVAVSKVDPKIAPIIAFGSSYSRQRMLREWVAAPELAMLCQYAKVVVKGIYQWERWGALPDVQRLPGELTAEPLFSLSYSAGLMAENHLAATLAPTKPKEQIYSPRAVFLAARDRVLSFMLARSIFEEGFTVTNYGMGAASVKVQKGSLSAFDDFVRQGRFAFPLAIEAPGD